MEKFYRKQQMEMPIQTQGNAMPQVKGFVSGLFLGGLVGAGAMLLLAPKSGKRTRARLQHQYEELRDQVVEGMEDAEEDVLAQTHRATANVRGKVKELRHRGQAMFDRK